MKTKTQERRKKGKAEQPKKQKNAKPLPLKARKYAPLLAQGALPWYFVATLLVLQLLGLLMLFSASYTKSYMESQNSYVYIREHFTSTALGLLLMLGVSKIDYHNYYRLSLLAYLGSVALMLLILIFCDPLNGAKRWVYFESGPLAALPAIQISEVVKFAVILIVAFFICQYRKRGPNQWGELLWPIVCLAPVALIMILQPHLSGTVTVCAIVGTMLVLSGAGGKQMLKLMGCAVVVGPVGSYVVWQLVKERAMTRLSEWTFVVQDMGWQTRQSIYAIGSGQLFGLGLGNGIQKQTWLPEPTNDFIFSVICEELGFIGATIVILLFVALIVEGFFIAFTAADLYGSLIAFGIVAQIGWQFIFNIGVVTSLLPNTGISLPLFSSGNSALLMLLLEFGVLLSVARAGDHARKARFAQEDAALEQKRTQRKETTGNKPDYFA